MQIDWSKAALGWPLAIASPAAEHKYLLNRHADDVAYTPITMLNAYCISHHQHRQQPFSRSHVFSFYRNLILQYFCCAAHDRHQQQKQPRRKRNMEAFAAPLLTPLAKPVSFAKIGYCERRQPQMSTGPRSVLRWLRGGAVAAAAAAVVHLGSCGGASATGLGVQENPVRIGSYESADVPRLPVRWELHSQGCDTETLVVVANESAASVDLLWVNYQGEEVQYATILPGRTHVQPSYATHPWVLRDHASQNSIMFVMAEKDPAIAVVCGDGPEAKATEEEIFRNPLKVTEAMLGVH